MASGFGSLVANSGDAGFRKDSGLLKDARRVGVSHFARALHHWIKSMTRKDDTLFSSVLIAALLAVLTIAVSSFSIEVDADAPVLAAAASVVPLTTKP